MNTNGPGYTRDHNILCQAVGYKYVRLYAPSATESVCPRGDDEREDKIRIDRLRALSSFCQSRVEKMLSAFDRQLPTLAGKKDF
jgi:hypothetical protein